LQLNTLFCTFFFILISLAFAPLGSYHCVRYAPFRSSFGCCYFCIPRTQYPGCVINRRAECLTFSFYVLIPRLFVFCNLEYLLFHLKYSSHTSSSVLSLLSTPVVPYPSLFSALLHRTCILFARHPVRRPDVECTDEYRHFTVVSPGFAHLFFWIDPAREMASTFCFFELSHNCFCHGLKMVC
jgi:hypothetical protein